MNIQSILFSAAEYAIIFPGIFICLVPVSDWLIIPQKKIYAILIPMVLAICILFGYIDSTHTYYINLFFFIILFACLIAYFVMVRLNKLKLLYLFLCATATLSFGCIANNYIIAHIDPTSNVHDKSIPGILIQYSVSIIIMIIFLLIKDKLKWIFKNFNTKPLWYMAWIVPAIVTFCNIYMIPIDYNNIRVGRVFQIAMVIEAVLLIFFIVFQILLYQIALTSSQKIELETSSLMYQTQAEQYIKLQAYMEQTRHIRHDFKHTIAVISELVQNRQYNELNDYISDYTNQISVDSHISDYCKNPAVNAIVGYYDNIASSYNIKTSIQIALPADSHISDVDLCLVFGNLLENAINACKLCDADSRYINLSCDTNTKNALYIAMVNSCNNNDAGSPHRSGIGLLSIKATAQKYNGLTRFCSTDNEYISNIMLSTDGFVQDSAR